MIVSGKRVEFNSFPGSDEILSDSVTENYLLDVPVTYVEHFVPDCPSDFGK